MSEIILPSYGQLSEVLAQSPGKMHPSEAHGLLCGMLCGDISQDWQAIILGDYNLAQPEALLEVLYTSSLAQLKDLLFSFQLLLPPDEESLALRAQALTFWVQGFLTGVKLTGTLVASLGTDVAEAMNDLIEIAQMNYDLVSVNEEDETAFIELGEYIRMAVLLIYQELQAIHATSPATKQTH